MKKVFLLVCIVLCVCLSCSQTEERTYQPVRIFSDDPAVSKKALEILSAFIERYGSESCWERQAEAEREIQRFFPSATVSESYEYIDTVAKEGFAKGLYRIWIIDLNGKKESFYLLPIKEEHGQYQSLFYQLYKEMEKEN